MQSSDLPVTFHYNMVNSIFCLCLNESLERLMAEFIGIAQAFFYVWIYIIFWEVLKSLWRSFYLTDEYSVLIYWIPKGMTAGHLPGFTWCSLENACGEGRMGFQTWTNKIPFCCEGVCFSCLQQDIVSKEYLWKRASAEAGDVTRFNHVCKIKHEL